MFMALRWLSTAVGRRYFRISCYAEAAFSLASKSFFNAPDVRFEGERIRRIALSDNVVQP
jgi:hypothetical protein